MYASEKAENYGWSLTLKMNVDEIVDSGTSVRCICC